MPAEEAQRVRGYLVAQAAKLTIPELVEKLRRDSIALRAASSSIPDGRFDEHVLSGEWSAAEVWAHVLEMNEEDAAMISGILDTGAAPASIDDRIAGDTRAGLRTTDDYWRIFCRGRDPLYARVLQASGDEHLDVKITHPNFGELNWREWLLFMRVHDLDHARQIEAIGKAMAS